MKEEYVNEEVTKKLIDKGCPVRLVIKADALIPILYELPKEHPDWQYCKAWYIPTIAQVLKWLRDEKKLHIRVSVYFIGWCVDVTNMDGKHVYSTECEYYTYEQAALAGIEYVLDNLI